MIKSELQSVLHYWCYGQHRADVIIQVLCVGFPHKKRKKKKKGDWSEIWPWAWAVRSLSKALAICQGGYLVGSTKYLTGAKSLGLILATWPSLSWLISFPPTKLSFYSLHYIKVCISKHQYPLSKKEKKKIPRYLIR